MTEETQRPVATTATSFQVVDARFTTLAINHVAKRTKRQAVTIRVDGQRKEVPERDALSVILAVP